MSSQLTLAISGICCCCADLHVRYKRVPGVHGDLVPVPGCVVSAQVKRTIPREVWMDRYASELCCCYCCCFVFVLLLCVADG